MCIGLGNGNLNLRRRCRGLEKPPLLVRQIGPLAVLYPIFSLPPPRPFSLFPRSLSFSLLCVTVEIFVIFKWTLCSRGFQIRDKYQSRPLCPSENEFSRTRAWKEKEKRAEDVGQMILQVPPGSFLLLFLSVPVKTTSLPLPFFSLTAVVSRFFSLFRLGNLVGYGSFFLFLCQWVSGYTGMHV